MNDIALRFISSYLLMPLLAIVFGIIAFIMAKRSKLLQNRKLIFFILLVAVALSIPALLGFINYWFMPYIYLALQLFYLVLGSYNIRWLKYFMNKTKGGRLKTEKTNEKDTTSFYVYFFIQFFMMFVGAALFSLVFNLCNGLNYGLWACTCVLPFILPPIYWETYKKFLAIPPEIYKEWRYSENEDLSFFESMDYDRLLVMELELFKMVKDAEPFKLKVKAPDNMPFGVWFQKCLYDYNIKFPQSPIQIQDENKAFYNWIFYVKQSFFHPRKYIDYELTIDENKIKEKYTIIAKRIHKIEEEQVKEEYHEIS